MNVSKFKVVHSKRKVYRPGALTKSQSQNQHMVDRSRAPKKGRKVNRLTAWGIARERRRLRKASPREGIAQERRRLAKVSPKKGVASLKHRPWKASPGKETVKWRYRRCYPSIPMGREDHGGGNTVRKSWAPMAQNSNEEKMASRP